MMEALPLKRKCRKDRDFMELKKSKKGMMPSLG
jgi:hypothetical protein